MIICDKCQNNFVIHPVDYEHPAHKLKSYVIETYFRCPSCNEKYIAYVTDTKARKMQKEIKRFHQQT